MYITCSCTIIYRGFKLVNKYNLTSAFIWPKYCRYGVKHYIISQSILHKSFVEDIYKGFSHIKNDRKIRLGPRADPLNVSSPGKLMACTF